jgi:hypothetical protein
MGVPVTGGNVGPAMIWPDPVVGAYDIFSDANKNGIYDAGIDAVDDLHNPGFTVNETAKVSVPALTPIGMIALIGLLSVIAVLTIRKKRE